MGDSLHDKRLTKYFYNFVRVHCRICGFRRVLEMVTLLKPQSTKAATIRLPALLVARLHRFKLNWFDLQDLAC